MPRTFAGVENQNTDRQKRRCTMPGLTATGIEEPKKETSEDYGRLKSRLPAVSRAFLTANLSIV